MQMVLMICSFAKYIMNNVLCILEVYRYYVLPILADSDPYTLVSADADTDSDTWLPIKFLRW